MLTAAMTENPDDVDVQLACARALGAISNVGGNIGHLVTRLDGLAKDLASTAKVGALPRDSQTLVESEAGMKDIDAILKPIGNLMMIEGMLNGPTSKALGDALQGTLTSLALSPTSKLQQDTTAQCLNLLARLAALDAEVDAETIVPIVISVLDDDNSSQRAKKAAVSAIAPLAMKPHAIQALVRSGAIAKVRTISELQNGGAIFPEDVVVDAEHALNVMSQVALSNCADLLGKPRALDNIKLILLGTNPKDLSVILHQIADLGAENLTDLLRELLDPDDPEGSNRRTVVVQAVINELLSQRDLNVELFPVGSPQRIESLVRVATLSPDAVVLLEKATETPEDCVALCETPEALNLILNGLNSAEPAIQNACATMLTNIVALDDPRVTIRLAEVPLGPGVMEMLKTTEDPDLVQNGLFCLAASAKRLDVPGTGLEKEDLRPLQDLLNEHKKRPYVLNTGAPLMAALANTFNGSTEALFEERVRDRDHPDTPIP